MSNNLKSFYSLYTFDMRALDTPVMVHMDHVSAVLDVDYSPTGKEFVSASFDKSIRIFPVDKSRSRYVITNKHLFVIFFFPWSSFIFFEKLFDCVFMMGLTLCIVTWGTNFQCIIYGRTSAYWAVSSLNRILSLYNSLPWNLSVCLRVKHYF